MKGKRRRIGSPDDEDDYGNDEDDNDDEDEDVIYSNNVTLLGCVARCRSDRRQSDASVPLNLNS